MSLLEERFLAESGRTLMDAKDKNAPKVYRILRKGIQKGHFVLRCGLFSHHRFCLDSVYSHQEV